MAETNEKSANFAKIERKKWKSAGKPQNAH